MTCRELIEALIDFTGSEQPPAERRYFEEHLDLCPDCRSYLASYRVTVELGRRVVRHPETGDTQDLPEELVRRILAAQRGG